MVGTMTSTPTSGHGHHPGHGQRGLGLLLGAIGIVFGDIGTSPLFTRCRSA